MQNSRGMKSYFSVFINSHFLEDVICVVLESKKKIVTFRSKNAISCDLDHLKFEAGFRCNDMFSLIGSAATP